jgi:predicted nucleotidyltransferase
MSALTPDQLHALSDLQTLWGVDGVVLVGASALGQHLDMRWRGTDDLDLTISASTADVVAAMQKLTGWTKDPRQPQRWYSPKDVKVDIIPAGPALLEAGQVIWSETGRAMNLVGFRLVFALSETREVAQGVPIRVATTATIALLKMVAYLDRPSERERDLKDLGYMMDEYLGPDDERRFSADAIDANVNFEETPAFVLGRDLAKAVNEQERAIIARFLAKMRDPTDGDAACSRFARSAPRSWDSDEEQVLKRLRAFETGLG